MMLTGCASVDQTTLPKIPVGSASILNTDKDTYSYGEKIKVSFFNSPGNEGDWICIVPAGTPDTEAGDYKYMPKGLGQGSLIFDPASSGKYEARAYYNYSRNGYVVSGRHAFSVGKVGGIVSPAATPGKATRDDYVLFQTVTLGDTNKKLTGLATSGSMAVLKTPNGNMVDYELWTKGNVSPNSNQEKKESVYGPVRFSRNPTSEEVSFSTKGFVLTEDVINQIMAQVEKNPRTEGTWNQEISLKLLRTYLPWKLAFHLNVQKIELKPGVQALLIRTYSDVFTIEILPTAANVNNGVFSGMLKSVLIYSPEDHRLYQMASSFDAGKGDETLQVQETAFLAGLDGKPVYPLIDIRKVLDLQKQDKPDPMVSMPLWAVQAMKVQQVVSLASGTTAERASNPYILNALAHLIEFDGFLGTAGFPSSASLIEPLAQIHGGQQGKLAAQLFSNVAPELLTQIKILPDTLLASGFPLIGQAVAAYAMWGIVADLGAAWIAQDIGKLTPFDWPTGNPMDRIAMASKLFDPKEQYVPPSEPGPIPEPPAAPSSARWVVPTVIGGVAIAAGVALAGGGGSSTESTSSSDCANYTTQVNSCGTGSPTMVGFLVPTRCGSCPSGSYYSGTDDIISDGGPYHICTCNGY